MQAWDVLRFGFGFRRFLDRHADARERIPTGRSEQRYRQAQHPSIRWPRSRRLTLEAHASKFPSSPSRPALDGELLQASRSPSINL